MLFNACIANTDDHLRNHGLLFDGEWRLAPAFDLVSTGGALHAIGLGTAGRERSLDNALSDRARFGLDAEAADDVLAEVREGLRGMAEALDQAGVPRGEAAQVLARLLS